MVPLEISKLPQSYMFSKSDCNENDFFESLFEDTLKPSSRLQISSLTRALIVDHYTKMPVHYVEIFKDYKIIFFGLKICLFIYFCSKH